jgi:hypothetical protein
MTPKPAKTCRASSRSPGAMLFADDLEEPFPRPARFLHLPKPADPERSTAINVKVKCMEISFGSDWLPERATHRRSDSSRGRNASANAVPIRVGQRSANAYTLWSSGPCVDLTRKNAPNSSRNRSPLPHSFVAHQGLHSGMVYAVLCCFRAVTRLIQLEPAPYAHRAHGDAHSWRHRASPSAATGTQVSLKYLGFGSHSDPVVAIEFDQRPERLAVGLAGEVLDQGEELSLPVDHFRPACRSPQ